MNQSVELSQVSRYKSKSQLESNFIHTTLHIIICQCLMKDDILAMNRITNNFNKKRER